MKAGTGHMMTIGEMLRQWLVKLEWYSTLFPRIPVPIQVCQPYKIKRINCLAGLSCYSTQLIISAQRDSTQLKLVDVIDFLVTAI